MGEERKLLVAFNRGIVSPIGLSRIDIKRMAMSAQTQTNFIPRVLGSMMLRPGFKNLGSVWFEKKARMFPFVFSADDTALVELTDNLLRVWVDDQVIRHEVVSTTVINGDFGGAGSWSDNDDVGTTSTITGGNLELTGDGTNSARRRQGVAVSGADQNIEHTIYLNVSRGPIQFRAGTSPGLDNLLSEVTLEEGIHYLRVTPTGAALNIEVSGKTAYKSLVNDCQIETGQLSIITPWAEANLDDVRVTQSGDVIFVAAKGISQYRIERRSIKSWSLVKYYSNAGPFRTVNTDAVTLTPSDVNGDITLTASSNTFRSTNIGSIYRISSVGQFVPKVITAVNDVTSHIRVVTANDPARKFNINITGNTSGSTIQLQMSVAAPGAWVDVSGMFWIAAYVATSYYDALDNQEIYYRLKCTTYVGPSIPTVDLTYASGSIDGIVRVVSYTSETVVNAIVLSSLGGTTGSSLWWEGSWSTRRRFPTANALYESRLWWVGSDKIFGSETDEYHSFDDTVEGDSGPIQRRIGEGPIEDIHWLLPLGRLLMGTSENSTNIPPASITNTSVSSVRSSSFGEPLTPNNFNVKNDTGRGIYVDRTKQRLYELTSSSKQYSAGVNDYASEDLSLFAPDLNELGITRIAVQLKPDIRVHCIRADGTVGMLVFDRAENVICWVEIETDGEIEDVVILPGVVEDQVYYVVKRTTPTSGAVHRHLEKWALESEARGGTVNKISDSFDIYSGVSQNVIAGLGRLEGAQLSVWANGKDLGLYTVSGGAVTGISESFTYAIVGLPYTAEFVGTKLATLEASSLNERRTIRELGLTLYKTHYQGIQYGPSLTQLYDLPQVENGVETPDDTIWDEYDEDMFSFGGDWDTDSRICLKAQSPKPCTVLSATVIIET